ncbi:MAG: hypothetical protein U1E90_16810 [Burkholderiaceae bacterium]
MQAIHSPLHRAWGASLAAIAPAVGTLSAGGTVHFFRTSQPHRVDASSEPMPLFRNVLGLTPIAGSIPPFGVAVGFFTPLTTH